MQVNKRLKNKSLYLIVAGLATSLFFMRANAQSYKPTYGSAFAGSTSIFNNPASSVNQSFKWEATILSAQANVIAMHFTFKMIPLVFMKACFQNTFMAMWMLIY